MRLPVSPARFRQPQVYLRHHAARALAQAPVAAPTSIPSKQSPAAKASYETLLQRLYQVNRFTAVKLGVENMKQLNAAFGDPASSFDVIHVAGSNGKGSVSLKLARALERSGYKTGLFVSPHISCFRERIQVNGELISEDDVVATLSQLFNVTAQLRLPATFFELTTMLAFLHFAKQNVDCVVLETGIGGRLDATNIVHPLLSVITSIGLDHMKVLGGSIEAITKEKAGIIKPNVPVVIGPSVPTNVISDFANRMNAKVVQVPPTEGYTEDYNAENQAIALEACKQLNKLSSVSEQSNLSLDLDHAGVSKALAMRPPCRFEVLHIVRPNSNERKISVVLDVAHNPPAIERLLLHLQTKFPFSNYRFVCGFSADKDIPKVLKMISEVSDRVHLVQADSPRAASLEEVQYAIEQSELQDTLPSFDEMTSVEQGINDAVVAARSGDEQEVVVVCGSVFLMPEARQALGIQEPVDSPALNEVAGSHLSTPTSRLAKAKASASD